MANPQLGTCYYPEHWPEEMWAADAAEMAALGISRVRVGEFAWSRIEPASGVFNWDWLDRAINTLAAAGLKVILCTPTATPPKWLIDNHDDILPWDADGRVRKFGSRRHYCFSSQAYRAHSARITTALGKRYGQHEAVVAWQTDNELGHHGTTRSYSPMAEKAFRVWLIEKYGDIASLNIAWGNVFWSMEYTSFEEIDLPNLTVIEPNPSHALDFARFSSDQVISFNRQQVEILRDLSPGRDIIHNFIGFFSDIDYYKMCQDLDVATWDSYPLGFLDQEPYTEEEKTQYFFTGHPDGAAFHHDLFRGCMPSKRWGVMEQQPGPVNWSAHNPAPAPGMVRSWSWEALAHGAELMSWFRWRQAPFAQEQMHAGLKRPDNEPAAGMAEAQKVAEELASVKLPTRGQAKVALLYSFEAKWMFEIQPQGKTWHYNKLCMAWYGAARSLGLDVDIISPEMDFAGYDLILVPSLPVVSDDLADRLKATQEQGQGQGKGQVILGPRSGSQTDSFSIPEPLPPGSLQKHLPLKVTHVESWPDGLGVAVKGVGGEAWAGETWAGEIRHWVEHIETELDPRIVSEKGHGLKEHGVWFVNDNLHYLAASPDPELLKNIIRDVAGAAGLTCCDVPEGVRLVTCKTYQFAFNYGPHAVQLPEEIVPASTQMVIGGRDLAVADMAVWQVASEM